MKRIESGNNSMERKGKYKIEKQGKDKEGRGGKEIKLPRKSMEEMGKNGK